MTTTFLGFPRLIDRRGLKPGRWFLCGDKGAVALCMLTAIGGDLDALVIALSLGRADALEFRTLRLGAVVGPAATVEDELVFTPGEAPERLRPPLPTKRPFPSGSLLRLSSGDMGVGFAETLNGRLFVVSLTPGLDSEGFDLVFERWSLSLRRGSQSALFGHFRGGAFRE
jgi:hypothetical protein